MNLEAEPQETKISCKEARIFVLERLPHKFDDILVAEDSPEFHEAVEAGVHVFSCPTKICQFLGLSLHIRNSGT